METYGRPVWLGRETGYNIAYRHTQVPRGRLIFTHNYQHLDA
jgi:hypothetical protein